MPAGRPKGAKNRRPVGEEFVKKAAQHRAAARLARVVPYDLHTNEKLDPMALLEDVMQHFYRKAKIEESLGRFCDFRIVDNALQNAARTAREIVSFRHPRISDRFRTHCEAILYRYQHSSLVKQVNSSTHCNLSYCLPTYALAPIGFVHTVKQFCIVTNVVHS